MVGEEPAALVDEPPALARGELRPGFLRLGRRLDRDIDVGGAALGRLADLLLRRRIDDRERLARHRRHHRAVDQQLVGKRARERARIEHGLEAIAGHGVLP